MKALKEQNPKGIERYLKEIDKEIPSEQIPPKDKAFMEKARAHLQKLKEEDSMPMTTY